MAMRTGLRYARLSPAIRTVVVRGLIFGLLGSSIWALMPLIARDLIRGGALTYGVLFGAFGGGAVLGAILSGAVRERFPSETMVRGASIAFGLTTIIAAVSPSLPLTMAAFVIGGGAWVLALSTFNITIQTSSPLWVVGRALATYQMVTFGGLAAGSWLWGVLADQTSLSQSLLASGAVMGVSALLGRKLPMPQPGSINVDPLRAWPEPKAMLEVAPESGPVVVTVEYRVAAMDHADFVAAMHEVRRIRRRDGARRWNLLQDLAEPEIWIERFQSPTWVEHLRHRHRFTVADQEIEQRALAFHRGSGPPRIRHMLERSPTAAPQEYRSELERVGERAAVTDPNLPPATMPIASSKARDNATS